MVTNTCKQLGCPKSCFVDDRQELKDHARDAAFMQMLQNLDRCHMNHDEKWALFTKLSADKLEFRCGSSNVSLQMRSLLNAILLYLTFPKSCHCDLQAPQICLLACKSKSQPL